MQTTIPLLLAGCTIISMNAVAGEEPAEATTIGKGPPRTLALYFFGMDLSGSVGIANASVPVDLPAAELLSNVKMGGMGYLQWRIGNGFVYGDGLLIRFEARQFDQFFQQDLDASIDLYEAGYGRRLYPSIDSLAGLELSPYVGMRYTKIDVQAKGPQVFQRAEQQWVDPVIGLFAELPLNKSISVILKLDVAGMGISHGHYESVALMVRYTFTPHWALGAGYRLANADYKASGADGINLDLSGNGPQAGIQYSF